MLNLISKLIEPTLSACCFVEHYRGLVMPISKFECIQGTEIEIEKVFPISTCANPIDCFGQGNDAVPNSSYKSLFYIESNGSVNATVQGAKKSQSVYSGSFRLVAFLNYQLLGITSDECNVDYQIINELIQKFESSKSFGDEDGKYMLNITQSRIVEKSARNIFGKYSYAEDLTNMFLYPHSFFAIDFNFNLTINNKCCPSFECGDALNCPQ